MSGTLLHDRAGARSRRATASGTRALERRLAPPELLVEHPLLLQLPHMLQPEKARRLELLQRDRARKKASKSSSTPR